MARWDAFKLRDIREAELLGETCEYPGCQETPIGEWLPSLDADEPAAGSAKWWEACGYRCAKHRDEHG